MPHAVKHQAKFLFILVLRVLGRHRILGQWG
jgi:hypothetical protein